VEDGGDDEDVVELHDCNETKRTKNIFFSFLCCITQRLKIRRSVVSRNLVDPKI
jgi:hypothetical protein